MVCVHLKALYDLCLTHQLKLGGHDLIRVVCTQCQKHDVCPSTIHEDGDAADLSAANDAAIGDAVTDLVSTSRPAPSTSPAVPPAS